MISPHALARAVAVAILTSACGTGAPDLGTLQRDPASAIRMPDAIELGHFSGDQRTTLEGPQTAFDSRVFGAQATEDAVRSFYDTKLRQLGWQSDRLAGVMTTVETAAWGWCKGAMVFRVGIEDQPRAFKPEFYRGQTFRTVYEAAIEGRDPTLGCPERLPR